MSSKNLTNKIITMTSPKIFFKWPILGVFIHFKTGLVLLSLLLKMNKVYTPWANINKTKAIRNASKDLIK